MVIGHEHGSGKPRRVGGLAISVVVAVAHFVTYSIIGDVLFKKRVVWSHGHTNWQLTPLCWTPISVLLSILSTCAPLKECFLLGLLSSLVVSLLLIHRSIALFVPERRTWLGYAALATALLWIPVPQQFSFTYQCYVWLF
jgi:hypothetical protein